MVLLSHYIHLWRGSYSFWIYHFLNSSYYVGCGHLCQSIIEVLLFDKWIFISTVITYISLLSLINARCFRMCQVLGIHLFDIGHHWSSFVWSFISFFIKWGFHLGLFLTIYIIFSLFFSMCPPCLFVECPISQFLIIYVKGQIKCHFEGFAMVILLA
jgi:hypothetical protein